MVRRIALAVAFLLGGVLAARAAPFTTTYTFTGSPGNQAGEPVDADPVGALFSDITRGPGLTPELAPDSFNSSGWTTTAFDADDYLQFTITPSPGFELDVSTVAFTVSSSGPGSPVFQLRSSLDGFNAAINNATIGVPAGENRIGYGPGSMNLTAPITFRLVGFSASSSLATLQLGRTGSVSFPNNLVVTGDLSPVSVPEPASLTLLGFGLAGLGARRLRQQ